MTHRTDGAYDLADGTKTCFAANGTYSTYLFARRAVQIIDDAVRCPHGPHGPHGLQRPWAARLDACVCGVSLLAQAAALAPVPFFLYLAFQNVHWPLEAPQPYLDRFVNTTGGDARRQACRNLTSHLSPPAQTSPPHPRTRPPAHLPTRCGQAVAAMAAILDDSVRNVTDALKRGGDPAALPLHQSL